MVDNCKSRTQGLQFMLTYAVTNDGEQYVLKWDCCYCSLTKIAFPIDRDGELSCPTISAFPSKTTPAGVGLRGASHVKVVSLPWLRTWNPVTM